MKYRTVVMYTEIGCFVSCLCGWILMCSTLATEYWTWSEVGGTVLTTANYFSNLWMDCISDTTGVSDCKYYPSMLGLSVFLHVCRALSIVAVILGFWGAVLTLIGMKCTKIGGSELANSRVTFAASLTYLASGFSGLILYSWWGNKIRSEFVDPAFVAQKFEIGAAVFVGWGGSCLTIAGSAVMCYFSAKEAIPRSESAPYRRPGTYMSARTRRTYAVPRSYVTARTKRTYQLPGSAWQSTVAVPTPPPVLRTGRDSQATRGSRNSTRQSRATRSAGGNRSAGGYRTAIAAPSDSFV